MKHKEVRREALKLWRKNYSIFDIAEKLKRNMKEIRGIISQAEEAKEWHRQALKKAKEEFDRTQGGWE